MFYLFINELPTNQPMLKLVEALSAARIALEMEDSTRGTARADLQAMIAQPEGQIVVGWDESLEVIGEAIHILEDAGVHCQIHDEEHDEEPFGPDESYPDLPSIEFPTSLDGRHKPIPGFQTEPTPEEYRLGMIILGMRNGQAIEAVAVLIAMADALGEHGQGTHRQAARALLRAFPIPAEARLSFQGL